MSDNVNALADKDRRLWLTTAPRCYFEQGGRHVFPVLLCPVCSRGTGAQPCVLVCCFIHADNRMETGWRCPICSYSALVPDHDVFLEMVSTDA